MLEQHSAKFYEKNGYRYEEVNPTPGNQDGGITTLVEKSTGNIRKAGTRSKVQGILALYEKPTRSGVWIIDHKCEGGTNDELNINSFAMAGAHMLLFTTGRGTPVGNAMIPVVRTTGNPESYRKMWGMMDFNAGVVIEGADLTETGTAFLIWR